MRETWVQSLGGEDPLEEGMANQSSILAWRIPMDRGAWLASVRGVSKRPHGWVTKHSIAYIYSFDYKSNTCLSEKFQITQRYLITPNPITAHNYCWNWHRFIQVFFNAFTNLCTYFTNTFIYFRSPVAAAAAAKSLQSCPTLCDHIDGSPPGSPIPGILQANILVAGM